MDRYRLKNVIIIILLLLNGFLLSSLAIRDSAARSSQQRTVEQLTNLFLADGITLHPDAVSPQSPPPSLTLSRAPELEKRVAAFFLGNTLEQEMQGDGVYTTYSNDSGVALFRSGGSFDIAGTLSESDSAEALCREFCKTFSFDPPVFTLDETGTGMAVAAAVYNKVPVFNCTVSFTIDHGTVMTVSGTLLSENSSSAPEEELYSAAAALTAFQKFRRESGASASQVSDMYLCYELQSSSASSIILSPTWCVVTDVVSYYVNCSSGVVKTG